MAGWHHQLNGHKFEQTLGDGDGQGRLACCSPWGREESDTTKQLHESHQWLQCLHGSDTRAVFSVPSGSGAAYQCLLSCLEPECNYAANNGSEEKENTCQPVYSETSQVLVHSSHFFFLTISKELYSLMRSCTVEPGTTDFGSSATLSIPPLWKIVWKFLKKLKVELPCDPAVPFLGIHLEKMKILNLQRYVHPSIHSNTVYSN